MIQEPQWWQWIVALAMMALFSWVGLSLLVDALPWKLIDRHQPGRREIGIILLFVLGGAGYWFLDEVFVWVWRGIQHILLLDVADL